MSYLWHSMRTLLGLILRRPLIGTCVIPLTPDGQIVLVRRRDTGRWGLPGGLVDWGEDVLAAASREVEEETGLEVTGVERLVGVYSSPGRDPRFHSVCISLVTYVQGVPKVGDPREILEVKAFPSDLVLQEDLSHDHMRHLQDYFKGATVLA